MTTILMVIILSSFLILVLVFLLNAATYNGPKDLKTKKNLQNKKNDKE